MRLTKKELMSAINQPMCFGSRLVGKKMFAQIIKELCEYKTIEEELGIDLITYFKIKKAKSVIVKELGHDTSVMLVRNSNDNISVCYKGFVNIPECDVTLYFKDYGKTWALTKEELK